MLEETHPTTFSELVRISGLSHGTDVWVGNAKSLIEEGVASLKGIICTRDDIMTYLIHAGLEKKMSFTIMESVRKGKGLKTEHEEAMHEKEVPQWYIDSCNKIKYMFPKAHAVAYVLMSYRIAYFKVHYPEAFYATYFSTKIKALPARGAEAAPKSAGISPPRADRRGGGIEPIADACRNCREYILQSL